MFQANFAGNCMYRTMIEIFDFDCIEPYTELSIFISRRLLVVMDRTSWIYTINHKESMMANDNDLQLISHMASHWWFWLFVLYSSNYRVLQPWGDILYESKPFSKLEWMVVFTVFYFPAYPTMDFHLKNPWSDLEWYHWFNGYLNNHLLV